MAFCAIIAILAIFPGIAGISAVSQNICLHEVFLNVFCRRILRNMFHEKDVNMIDNELIFSSHLIFYIN